MLEEKKKACHEVFGLVDGEEREKERESTKKTNKLGSYSTLSTVKG